METTTEIRNCVRDPRCNTMRAALYANLRHFTPDLDSQFIPLFRKAKSNVCSSYLWFSLQQAAVPVDVYHTEVVFKPAAILPYVNIEQGKNGATGNDGDTGSEFTQTVPSPSESSTPVTVPGKTGGATN